MSSQVLATNEMLSTKVLAANKVGDVGDSDGSNDGLKRVEPKLEKLAKSLKLFKSGNLKGKKLAKFKKLSKSRNLPNFDAKKAGASFLTPEARSAFNRLRLAFTKDLILWHFDPKCHI